MPTPEVNALVRYFLIHACSEYGEEVEVTAYCALSNHHHLLVTDRVGGEGSKVSDFCRDLHANLAKRVNLLQGRSGVVWDPARSFSQVEVFDFHAEIAQWVYVAGQAVAAGLVERPEDWPGICWLPEDVGQTLTAERPDSLFESRTPEARAQAEAYREAQARLHADLARAAANDVKRGRSPKRRRQLALERERRGLAKLPPPPPPPKTDLPERVSYKVPLPKCLRGWEVEDAQAYLREALDHYVAQIHERRREEGLGFLGPEALQDQDPMSPPPGTAVQTQSCATYEHIPRLATRGLEKEVASELVADLFQYHLDYREALDLLRSEAPWRARFPKGAQLRVREQRRVLAAYRAQPPPRRA